MIQCRMASSTKQMTCQASHRPTIHKTTRRIIGYLREAQYGMRGAP